MLNKSSLLRIGLLFFSLIYSFSVLSQTQSSGKVLVQIAEDYYGPDDRIINGTISDFFAPNAEGHPFFINSNWQAGRLFSAGIEYSELALKYNIESDDIFFINNHNNFSPLTVLNKFLIDSVIIANRTLVNTDKIATKNPLGFAELIHRGKYPGFLKHRVTKNTRLTDTYEYFEFSHQPPVIYILKNDEFIALKTKKDFISEYSLPEKQLKKFLRQYNIQLKKASHSQIIQLLKYCDELSTL